MATQRKVNQAVPKPEAEKTSKVEVKQNLSLDESIFSVDVYHYFSWGLAAICIILPSIYLAIDVMASRQRHVELAAKAGIEFPPLWDLVYAFLLCFVVIAFRKAMTPSLEALGLRVLSAHKAADPDRVQRFATVTFKTTYYIVISIIGYNLLKTEMFTDPLLGGSGRIELMFEGWPYHQISFSMRCYIITELSYHCHSMIWLTMYGMQRNDKFEMLIHHSVTLVLIWMSWGLNFTRVAAIILFVHDIGDVTVYGIKVVVDTDWKNLTAVCLVLLLTSWAYTRLWFFPNSIIRCVLTTGTPVFGSGGYAFAALLSLLVCLHYYWYGLICIMAKNAIAGGWKPEDTYMHPDKDVAKHCNSDEAVAARHREHHSSKAD